MGACQSSEVYVGFINLNVTHLDVLSFALGALFAVALWYLVNYCKLGRRANKHVLRGAPGPAHAWGPPGAYNIAMPSWSAPTPDPTAYPTAPYPGSSAKPPLVMIPWPSNALS